MVTTFAPTKSNVDVDVAPPLVFDFPLVTILPEAVPEPAPAPARAHPKRKPAPLVRKLSALIRRGAQKAEGQVTHNFVQWTGSGVRVCAMGAAALGARRGVPKSEAAADHLAEQWRAPLARRGVDTSVYVKNPVSRERQQVDTACISLNDGQGWTLYQIADWLESIGL